MPIFDVAEEIISRSEVLCRCQHEQSQHIFLIHSYGSWVDRKNVSQVINSAANYPVDQYCYFTAGPFSCCQQCPCSTYIPGAIMSGAELEAKDPLISKEEKYRLIFNHTKDSIKLESMTPQQIADRIHLLESALADLLFEKRTEIAAYSDELHNQLENADEVTRERVRRSDKKYTAERQRGEGEKIQARAERLDKREQLIQKLMKANISREKAEEMAKNIK